ncbi:MAG: hypothetical protein KDB82_12820 [Planctomycetes bacterium]|nr:hypothetical protein [Planctomycetota bacterium]
MGEYSLYFVPENQGRFVGRENEVAEAFWKLGVFLATEDDFIFERIAELEKQGSPLPEWEHDFEFGEMGLQDDEEASIVPQELEALELTCPHCDEDITEQAYDVFDDIDESPQPVRPIRCVGCGKTMPFKDLKHGRPYTFARFHLWVSDADPDYDGEDFRRTVEKVLGPCTIYRAMGD